MRVRSPPPALVPGVRLRRAGAADPHEMPGRDAQTLEGTLGIPAHDLHPATLVEDHAVLPRFEVGVRLPPPRLGGRGRRLDREAADVLQSGASEMRFPDVELDVA